MSLAASTELFLENPVLAELLQRVRDAGRPTVKEVRCQCGNTGRASGHADSCFPWNTAEMSCNFKSGAPCDVVLGSGGAWEQDDTNRAV